MSTILICGEGAHDVGVKEWDSKTGSHVYREGWLQPLLRKAVNENIVVKAKRLTELMSFRKGHEPKPLPKGHGYKAALARYLAEFEKCEVVVFMVDADTNDEDERLAKVASIKDGFDAIINEVRSVTCVPMSTSESWLLSDPQAWSEIGLRDLGVLPSGCPEDTWGARNDPKGGHPKHAFARAVIAADVPDNRDTRNRLCEASALEVLIARCPKSLGQFVKDLEGIC